MDDAEVPGGPFTPNHSRDWLMALVLGLALGVAAAYTVEYLDDTVKLPDDVTRRLKLPLLGLVPAVGGDKLPVLTSAVPHDFGEAFRSLRTSLVFTNGSPGNRTIAVTSTQPLEGKTTTACNLAVALALGGARVMLIDADMRRPGLHRTMGIPNEIGLSHVLTGQARVREAVQRTSENNLFVMTAGHVPPNPSELLSSERMRHLIANLEAGPVRLGHHRHATGAGGDRRGHPRAVHVRPGLRDRRGDDASRPRRARHSDDPGGQAEHRWRGAQPRGPESQQVLLLPLLRLPLQELLRGRRLADSVTSPMLSTLHATLCGTGRLAGTC